MRYDTKKACVRAYVSTNRIITFIYSGRDNPTVQLDDVETRPKFVGYIDGQSIKTVEYLDVVEFAEETPCQKWTLRLFSGSTLVALVFLWVYYR